MGIPRNDNPPRPSRPWGEESGPVASLPTQRQSAFRKTTERGDWGRARRCSRAPTAGRASMGRGDQRVQHPLGHAGGVGDRADRHDRRTRFRHRGLEARGDEVTDAGVRL